MKSIIDEIVEDLKDIDWIYMENEEKFRKMIWDMISVRPNTNFKDTFKQNLREKLISEINTSKATNVKKTNIFSFSFRQNRFLYYLLWLFSLATFSLFMFPTISLLMTNDSLETKNNTSSRYKNNVTTPDNYWWSLEGFWWAFSNQNASYSPDVVSSTETLNKKWIFEKMNIINILKILSIFITFSILVLIIIKTIKIKKKNLNNSDTKTLSQWNNFIKIWSYFWWVITASFVFLLFWNYILNNNLKYGSDTIIINEDLPKVNEHKREIIINNNSVDSESENEKRDITKKPRIEKWLWWNIDEKDSKIRSYHSEDIDFNDKLIEDNIKDSNENISESNENTISDNKKTKNNYWISEDSLVWWWDNDWDKIVEENSHEYLIQEYLISDNSNIYYEFNWDLGTLKKSYDVYKIVLKKYNNNKEKNTEYIDFQDFKDLNILNINLSDEIFSWFNVSINYNNLEIWLDRKINDYEIENEVENILSNNEILSASNIFLKNIWINISNYWTPIIDEEWRNKIKFDRNNYNNTNIFTIVYPKLINWYSLYDMNWNIKWIYVNINPISLDIVWIYWIDFYDTDIHKSEYEIVNNTWIISEFINKQLNLTKNENVEIETINNYEIVYIEKIDYFEDWETTIYLVPSIKTDINKTNSVFIPLIKKFMEK